MGDIPGSLWIFLNIEEAIAEIEFEEESDKDSKK
jgi:hypothetical protein